MLRRGCWISYLGVAVLAWVLCAWAMSYLPDGRRIDSLDGRVLLIFSPGNTSGWINSRLDSDDDNFSGPRLLMDDLRFNNGVNPTSRLLGFTYDRFIVNGEPVRVFAIPYWWVA